MEAGLLGVQPVDVAAQGVDLAVVGQVAVGVSAVPGGEGVGAEARVDHAQRGFEGRVGQFRIEWAHLVGGQHAFIHDGLEGHRADVELLPAGQAGIADALFGALADDVQLAFEGHAVFDQRAALDEHLAHHRLGGPGGGAQRAAVGGYGAPAKHALALFTGNLLETLLKVAAQLIIPGQEEHAHAVVARAGQGKAQFGALCQQEGMRNLDQHPGAVAGIRFAAAGAAMRQVVQNGQPLFDDGVRGDPFDIDDEACSAGVVFELWVVKPLFWGNSPVDGMTLG